MSFNEVSQYRVELRWLQADVTYDSPARLVRLASVKDASFEILGEPIGIADDVDIASIEAAAVAPTGVADDAREALVEAAAVAPVEAAKRRRIVRKGLPLAYAALAESASDADPATANDTDATAAPTDAAQAATRRRGKSLTPLEETGSAPELLPHRLLSLKSEYICLCDFTVDSYGELPKTYDVDWKKPLGEGTFGTVYPGYARGVARQPVAIKMLNGADMSARATQADAEVRRHAALPSHPHIVKLLDIGLFQRLRQQPTIGLVFEQFDTDVLQFLKRRPLKVAGMRHVLRSVLAALAYMHEHGLVHADVKPANILLRGACAFQDEWRRLLEKTTCLIPSGGAESASGAASASGYASARGAASVSGGANVDEPMELTYHLPALFEVRCFIYFIFIYILYIYIYLFVGVLYIIYTYIHIFIDFKF